MSTDTAGRAIFEGFMPTGPATGPVYDKITKLLATALRDLDYQKADGTDPEAEHIEPPEPQPATCSCGAAILTETVTTVTGVRLSRASAHFACFHSTEFGEDIRRWVSQRLGHPQRVNPRDEVLMHPPGR